VLGGGSCLLEVHGTRPFGLLVKGEGVVLFRLVPSCARLYSTLTSHGSVECSRVRWATHRPQPGEFMGDSSHHILRDGLAPGGIADRHNVYETLVAFIDEHRRTPGPSTRRACDAASGSPYWGGTNSGARKIV
jgi:hypothetical protein